VNNPLYAAAAAARAARYARPQQSGYTSQVPEQEESDEPKPIQVKSELDTQPAAPGQSRSVISSAGSNVLQAAGSTAASGLSAVGNLLDVPEVWCVM
jgi:hypothetical protein